jgi:hypothetical protein
MGNVQKCDCYTKNFFFCSYVRMRKLFRLFNDALSIESVIQFSGTELAVTITKCERLSAVLYSTVRVCNRQDGGGGGD